MLLLLAQSVLWTTLARYARMSPSGSAEYNRAIPDMAVVAIWVACFTGGQATFHRRSLLNMLLASPNPRSLIALSLVLPVFLISALMGLLPCFAGLPEALPSMLFPFLLLAFALACSAVWLMLVLPSGEMFAGTGLSAVLLLTSHSSLTSFPHRARVVEALAFDFLREHVDKIASYHHCIIIFLYALCVFCMIVRRIRFLVDATYIPK